MILIDFTQIAIGGLMTQIHHGKNKIDDFLVRHVVLNTLRYYRSKFNEKYGELVICCDSKHYWRRDYFPNYKANRKKDREKSEYDWGEIFTLLNLIKEEIKKNFPYKVIEIYGAEADDIIAVLTRERNDNVTIIISSDKDFIQLHNNIIEQYSPVTKKLINGKDPVNFLREHIIRGDRSDGVPNVLSPDDTFTEGKRQKPLRKTVVGELLDMMTGMDPEVLHMLAKCPRDTWIRNWQRNETLIDLTKIPTSLVQEILVEFDEVKVGNRKDLFNYFVEKRLNNLVENLGEF